MLKNNPVHFILELSFLFYFCNGKKNIYIAFHTSPSNFILEWQELDNGTSSDIKKTTVKTSN
jgi:hypothetical protein